ncbi:MAG TPA: ABC transporter permease [Ohtaekwangia sp.]|uniref:ABC transporter permease n=1 Tax=Ohtaekwangia sp. TaxID=2066019 RepID=UPI002F940FB7
MAKHPADFWLRVLSWYCPPSLYEGIEGDIREQFEHDARLYGTAIAKRRLIWNTLRFFRPGIILRNKFSTELINLMMLTNYLITAYRNIRKSKAFSAINICGLGIGLAACLLIFQFVTFELSYDTFNEKFDRIYRVTNDRFQHGKLIQHGTIMYPTIGPVMARDYPEIEMYTRIMPSGELNVKVNNVNHRGDYCHFADEHFLSVFTFPMLAGDKTTALKVPYTIVLPESTAKKYFGVGDGDYSSVLGKVLYWGLDPQPYTVTGVCMDPPANSHIQFGGLVSYATLIRPDDHDADDSWRWSDMRHYLVLKPGADYKKLEAKFDAFSDKYFQGDKVSGSVEKFFLQPLKDAHLYSDYEYDIAKTANGKAVWAMLIVALFILLIAWINYINLTTSRAIDRAKEVGLRKVMGALKSQLVKQFIVESTLITALACMVSVILVLSLQSYFNTIVENNLSPWKELMSLSPATIGIIVVAGIVCILLSGFYPAFILSSYQPVVVLKGKFQRSSRGHFLRKALVVFQFTASAALITGTIIVSRQLSYMNDADLGINIHNTMIVDSPELTSWDSTTIDRIENYKHALMQIDGVINATTSNNIPGNRLGRAFGIRLTDQPSEQHYTMSVLGVDYNFFDTYDVKIEAGRKFLPTDHKVRYEDLTTVVVNKNAVKLLGIDSVQDAIGKEIFWGGDDGTRRWTIVGVIGDFHQESLKKPLEAMIFRPVYSTYSPTSIRLKTEDQQKVIAEIERTYKAYFPGNSFQYSFLEDSYKRQYNDDNRFGNVISIFTVLAIIISCLGLIGLSSYTAVQRTKEIGVRKVLGASIYSIVSLLSMDFMRLVFIAAALSLPIAYISMRQWLEEYTYRISLSWILFVLPVLVVLAIALITISFQVLRAAMTNPADTLKYE